MAELINLNKVRKAKARAAAAANAKTNRVTYGLTKAAKTASDAAKAKLTKHLNDHKREP